jgi:hypothetical protein
MEKSNDFLFKYYGEKQNAAVSCHGAECDAGAGDGGVCSWVWAGVKSLMLVCLVLFIKDVKTTTQNKVCACKQHCMTP